MSVDAVPNCSFHEIIRPIERPLIEILCSISILMQLIRQSTGKNMLVSLIRIGALPWDIGQ